jgi:hypothetical protein
MAKTDVTAAAAAKTRPAGRGPLSSPPYEDVYATI